MIARPLGQSPAFIAEKEALAEVMERHGIEWEQKGTHEKHLSVLDFEKKQRAEEVEQLNAEIESAKTDLKAVERQLNQTVPKLKNAEKLAADFPDDVDKLLPEAGALESAKTYREKKAKPVLEKAVRLIKSLYHSVLDLQAENRDLRAKNESWFCCQSSIHWMLSWTKPRVHRQKRGQLCAGQRA